MTYEDVLLDHNRRPRNRREISGATHSASARNPICGDEVTVEIRIDAAGVIQDIGFRAQACAICTASASMLTTAIQGQDLLAARGAARHIREALAKEADAEVDPCLSGDLAALAGVRRFPVRIPCATLPWKALEDALG
jgi:nitrogen fixation NifU-like protein